MIRALLLTTLVAQAALADEVFFGFTLDSFVRGSVLALVPALIVLILSSPWLWLIRPVTDWLNSCQK